MRARLTVIGVAIGGFLIAALLSAQEPPPVVEIVNVRVEQQLQAPASADATALSAYSGVWTGTLAAAPHVGDQIEWAAEWAPLAVKAVTIGRSTITVEVEDGTVTFEMKEQLTKLGWDIR